MQDTLRSKRERVKKDLENSGFFVNDGIKYGLDLLVYTDHPDKVHSKYGVLIYREITYQQLVLYQRVCNSNNKILLIANPKKNAVEYVECERFIV